MLFYLSYINAGDGKVSKNTLTAVENKFAHFKLMNKSACNVIVLQIK